MPDLVNDNRLVVFVHGDYLASELKDDDQKLRLFSKLLERSHPVEQSVAEAIATAMANATKLPPVEYGPGSGSIHVGDNPYVFARNLAANRLVNGPVVFLEPYYMNNRLVYRTHPVGRLRRPAGRERHAHEEHFSRVCRRRGGGIEQANCPVICGGTARLIDGNGSHRACRRS